MWIYLLVFCFWLENIEYLRSLTSFIFLVTVYTIMEGELQDLLEKLYQMLFKESNPQRKEEIENVIGGK